MWCVWFVPVKNSLDLIYGFCISSCADKLSYVCAKAVLCIKVFFSIKIHIHLKYFHLLGLHKSCSP